jgi:hypothetical protein
MRYARHFLKKERSRLDERLKETVGDLFFYRDLDPYLRPEDRKKKVERLEAKEKELREALEEIDFLLELMDRAGIDEIFSKYRRGEIFYNEPQVLG